ncbi:MAG: hypothetical protein BIFFINMI_04331 [Phycisphaerae bacterium]|nr:hypothetical protein [Phycisphaerae bacterium]
MNQAWTIRRRAKAGLAALAALAAGLTILLAATPQAMGDEPAAAPAAAADSGAVIGQGTLWRCFKGFRTPDVRNDEGKLEPRNINAYWGGIMGSEAKSVGASPLPDAAWVNVDFDDATWDRLRAPLAPRGNLEAGDQSYDLSLILARARFNVDDPAKVKALTLTVNYQGGAAVYLNGRLIARGHLGGDRPDLQAPGEDYPREAYVTPEGKLLRPDDKNNKDRIALRDRKLDTVAVPLDALRKGVNVLAVEVHRSPIPAVVGGQGKGPSRADAWAAWPPVALLSVELSASVAGAVSPNVARPAGVQVWTCDPIHTLGTSEYRDPCEPLTPVDITAARNGVFSGRVVVSSDQPIRGLAAKVSDLADDKGGKIAAAQVQVRYGEPAIPANCAVPAGRFDGLLDAIPAEIPVVGTGPDAGAVAPIWLTVRVPAGAAPGDYRGTVTLSADGLSATAVPVVLHVSGWTLADPKDFRVHNFGQVSTDSLARRYDVERWSDRHLALIAQSMKWMAQINSREVLVDLCINFYGGNKGAMDSSNVESMVRWIRQADGSYKHDYAVLDKYLDMVAKAIGQPMLLRINAWGEWGTANMKTPEWHGPSAVSLLDPATGKLEALDQPPGDKPEFVAFWKPVLGEVRKKIEARGWWGATAMGANSYCWGVGPAMVDALHEIWPDAVWAYTAHNGTLAARAKGATEGVSALIRYADCVWSHGKPVPRGAQQLLKPRAGDWCFTFRGHRDNRAPSSYRTIPERELSMGQDGYSDFGVDFFPFPGARGRLYRVGNGRGTGGPNDGTLAILAPGPDEPIATERFEMLREGVQLAEAVLFLERALADKKIDGDLAARVNRLLDERGRLLVNNWLNSRLIADRELLATAGEVAAAVANR